MTRPLLLILAFLTLCPFHVSAQDCERETDEFKGIDKIVCDSESITVTEQPGETIYRATVFAAITSETSSPIAIITTISDSWNFLKTDTAYFLVDGKRIEVPAKRVETETSDGRVIEQKGLMLNEQQAQQISQADTVRMKMGTAVFQLDPLSPLLSEIFRLMNQ